MRASDRTLRRHVRDQLRSLELEPPLSVEELCRRFGGQRGRPIELMSTPLPATLSGLTLVTPDVDVIVYQSETTRPHQHWVTTHELGHIMLNHAGFAPTDEGLMDIWRTLMPNLSEGHLQRALARSCGDDAEEQDAETTARIIRSWASVLDHVYPAGFDRATPGWVRAALSERHGWL